MPRKGAGAHPIAWIRMHWRLPALPCPTVRSPSDGAGLGVVLGPALEFLRTSCAQLPKTVHEKGLSESLRALAVEWIGATGFEPAT